MSYSSAYTSKYVKQRHNPTFRIFACPCLIYSASDHHLKLVEPIFNTIQMAELAKRRTLPKSNQKRRGERNSSSHQLHQVGLVLGGKRVQGQQAMFVLPAICCQTGSARFKLSGLPVRMAIPINTPKNLNMLR